MMIKLLKTQALVEVNQAIFLGQSYKTFINNVKRAHRLEAKASATRGRNSLQSLNMYKYKSQNSIY